MEINLFYRKFSKPLGEAFKCYKTLVSSIFIFENLFRKILTPDFSTKFYKERLVLLSNQDLQLVPCVSSFATFKNCNVKRPRKWVRHFFMGATIFKSVPLEK